MALRSPAPAYLSDLHSQTSKFSHYYSTSNNNLCRHKFVIRATATATPPGSRNDSLGKVFVFIDFVQFLITITRTIEFISCNLQMKRVGEMSQEIKRMRAQMEENEELAILMRGLRGQNLTDSQFAADDVQLRLVEVSFLSFLLLNLNFTL